MPDEAVRATERRVDLGADADEAAGDGELELVGLGVERDDAGVDGLAAVAARAVLGDDAGADLDLHAEAEHAGEDRATRDAALELVDLRAGLVHVEGADHDQARVRGEVPRWDRDPLHDVLVYRVDVVFQLG